MHYLHWWAIKNKMKENSAAIFRSLLTKLSPLADKKLADYKGPYSASGLFH
jgi:hypothetical protein